MKKKLAACCGKKRRNKAIENIDGEWRCKPGFGCQHLALVKVKVKPLPIEPEPAPVEPPPEYCGKFMYDLDGAKSAIRHSKGELKGHYFCDDCQAYHVTRQRQEPSRVEWFKNNKKLFRNKHR